MTFGSVRYRLFAWGLAAVIIFGFGYWAWEVWGW